jgi:hypothetical protein
MLLSQQAGANPNTETMRGTPLLCAVQSDGAFELITLLMVR